ncbi:MAG: helix-turn-helix domain-containing protein, partial [Candidatus Diapherotrites archaeon]|nr:helix-turn-helix domain-containing protein [Candidatus Diapherotrites archaeon]
LVYGRFLEAARLAIKEIDLPNLAVDEFSPHVRFYNLPEGRDTHPQLRDIGSAHLGRLISIEGVAAQITDVLPKLKAATWECRRCGNTYRVIQAGNTQQQPTMCECRNRDFILKAEDSDFMDYQKIRIQEPIELIKGNNQPTHIDIYVSDDLVNRVGPGDRTKFCGVLRLMPPKEKKLVYGRFLEAIHIEETRQEFTEVEISKEEEIEIKKLSQNPNVYEKLVKSIAPNIYGHETIKEAIVLQLFGGVKKVFPGNNRVRGNIHVILIGEPGMAKCVDGETKLLLADGTEKKISELVEEELDKHKQILDDGYYSNTLIRLPALNNDCNFVEGNGIRAYKRKPERMFYIKSATGREIKTTHTHPLFVSKNGKVKALKTMEVKPGDFIAVPRKIFVKGTEQPLETEIDRGKTNSIHINLPKKVNEEMARFYGYLLAEGYMHKSKNFQSARFVNSDKEVVEDFICISEKLFGLKAGKRFRNNAFEIMLPKRELCRFLRKNFPQLFELSKNKKISSLIMSSTDSVVKEMIKSFVETEGCIRKDARIIEVSSASKELMENLTILLARFGIIGSMKKIWNAATNTKNKTKRDYFRLRIMGKFAAKYALEIGFISERKIRKAQECILSQKKFNTNTDIVPNIGQELLFLRKKFGLTQFEMGVKRDAYQHYEREERNPSREQLFLIANKLIEEYFNTNLFDKEVEEKTLNLFKLSKADIFWDKIKEIREIEPADWVYDLEVEGTHNFISNMVFSHNSQLLQAVDKIAPKSIYTAGKTTSAAGISATAVKDEFGEGGWTIKAGALVLASGGIALIDELDKMDANDRSALHESMEQESYHKNFKIDLLGRPREEIGEFVEKLFEENKEKIVCGKDTLFLNMKGKGFKILTTDFEKIYETDISQISKHKADKDFFEINFQNGRKIIVTENHPIFVLKNGEIKTVSANELKETDYVPAPTLNPFEGNEQEIKTFETIKAKKTTFPNHNSAEFFRFLGYHITDGGYELNRGQKNGINFANTCTELIEDYVHLIKKLFSINPYIYHGKHATNVRLISKPLYNFMKGIDEKLVEKSQTKRIPPQFMNAKTKDLSQLLKAVFDGDGGFYYADKIPRLKLVTPNYEFAEQVQDLLLRFGIVSVIFTDKNYKAFVYRVDITGRENIEKYAHFIGFTHQKKKEKLEEFIKTKAKTRGDIIPNCSKKIMCLVQELKIRQNSFQKANLLSKKNFSRKKFSIYIEKLLQKLSELRNSLTIIEQATNIKQVNEIRKKLRISNQMISNQTGIDRSLIDYYERAGSNKQIQKVKYGLLKAVENLLEKEIEVIEMKKIVFGEQRWIKIKKIQKIPKGNEEWVYDIGIEPEHCFISNNLTLHNSISVAKAGIVTRFKSETSILSAANPKYSRFDPYTNFMEQINLPPSLMSRFDLFFLIRDVLDRKKDEEIAQHILKTHRAGELLLQKGKEKSKELQELQKSITPEIEGEFFKKFISYARQTVFPVLTLDAIEDISQFYINLRDQGRKEG